MRFSQCPFKPLVASSDDCHGRTRTKTTAYAIPDRLVRERGGSERQTKAKERLCSRRWQVGTVCTLWRPSSAAFGRESPNSSAKVVRNGRQATRASKASLLREHVLGPSALDRCRPAFIWKICPIRLQICAWLRHQQMQSKHQAAPWKLSFIHGFFILKEHWHEQHRFQVWCDLDWAEQALLSKGELSISIFCLTSLPHPLVL